MKQLHVVVRRGAVKLSRLTKKSPAESTEGTKPSPVRLVFQRGLGETLVVVLLDPQVDVTPPRLRTDSARSFQRSIRQHVFSGIPQSPLGITGWSWSCFVTRKMIRSNDMKLWFFILDYGIDFDLGNIKDESHY